jgi:hypothetical protein
MTRHIKRLNLTKKEQLNKIITNDDGTPDQLGIDIYWYLLMEERKQEEDRKEFLKRLEEDKKFFENKNPLDFLIRKS